MLTPLAGMFMFLSSFSPLFLMFALRTDHQVLRATLIGVSAAGALVTLFVLRLLGRTEPVQIEVTDVASRDSEAVAYLATYLLPFLLVSDPELRDIITLAVFLAILAILYVRSNMVYINPLLALFGYHLFAVRLPAGSGEDVIWILARNERMSPGSIHGVKLVGNVWLRREDRERV